MLAFKVNRSEQHLLHLVIVADDLVFHIHQLVGRLDEDFLDFILSQMWRLTLLVIPVFVVTPPDGSAVFGIAMPNLRAIKLPQSPQISLLENMLVERLRLFPLVRKAICFAPCQISQVG